MKSQANLIRPGWVIEHQGRQWSVLKVDWTQPGKGGAYVQVEMRDINTGNKTNERLRSAETVEKLMVEQRKCQYLFEDGELLTFMESDTYEQFMLPKDALGTQFSFLQDGMDVEAEYIDGKPISVRLPMTVICEISETEAVVKGQTAASSNKPAILDNGVRIMVPPFVKVGDKVVVNPEDASYVERAKK